MDLNDVSCIGQCGLIKRPELDIPEIGFALLEEYQNQGYVSEAAIAVMQYAFLELGLDRLAAMAKPDNIPSITVLSKLNMPFVKGFKVVEDQPQVKYFELQKANYLEHNK